MKNTLAPASSRAATESVRAPTSAGSGGISTPCGTAGICRPRGFSSCGWAISGSGSRTGRLRPTDGQRRAVVIGVVVEDGYLLEVVDGHRRRHLPLERLRTPRV